MEALKVRNPLTRIGVVGFGRMGKEIAKHAAGAGCELLAYADDAKSLPNVLLSLAEVAIEFTTPDAAPHNVRRLLGAGKSVVCGTTGWQMDEQELRQLATAHSAAFLHATNFSLGVQVFLRTAASLAAALDKVGGYGFSIDETHHDKKLDAPSGTALSLFRRVSDALEQPQEVPIVAKRQGDVVGYHKLTAKSNFDSIQLMHDAHERTGFALGALAVSRWLAGKVGAFTMQDYLDDVLGPA